MIIPVAKASSPGLTNAAKDIKLKKSCTEFEGQFYDMMLQEMRKTVPQDPLLGDDGNAQDIFQTMMDDHTAQAMAEQGGANDLASMMFKQLNAAHKDSLEIKTNPAAPNIQLSQGFDKQPAE